MLKVIFTIAAIDFHKCSEKSIISDYVTIALHISSAILCKSDLLINFTRIFYKAGLRMKYCRWWSITRGENVGLQQMIYAEV